MLLIHSLSSHAGAPTRGDSSIDELDDITSADSYELLISPLLLISSKPSGSLVSWSTGEGVFLVASTPLPTRQAIGSVECVKASGCASCRRLAAPVFNPRFGWRPTKGVTMLAASSATDSLD